MTSVSPLVARLVSPLPFLCPPCLQSFPPSSGFLQRGGLAICWPQSGCTPLPAADWRVPGARRMCHFLLSVGSLQGWGWLGSQAITQASSSSCPPAKPEVVQRPAIGSFLIPPGEQLTQPVYPACCQDSTMGCPTPVSVPTSGSLSTPLDLGLDISIDGSCVKKHFL